MSGTKGRSGGAREGAGRPVGPRKKLEVGEDMAQLIFQLRQANPEATDDLIISEIAQLAFMVSNWQALANIAEVMAPDLLNNQQWTALKADLERRTNEIGVTAFIDVIGEQYKAKTEEQDEPGSQQFWI